MNTITVNAVAGMLLALTGSALAAGSTAPKSIDCVSAKSSLQTVIDRARVGDTINVSGTCKGNLHNNSGINGNQASGGSDISPSMGGGLYALDSAITMEDSSTINNNSTDFAGGGAFLAGTTPLTLKGELVRISSNSVSSTATYSGGAGVYIQNRSSILTCDDASCDVLITGNSPDNVKNP